MESSEPPINGTGTYVRTGTAANPGVRPQGHVFPTYDGDDPHKRVGLAVLLQAIKDAHGPDWYSTTAAARAWLAGRYRRQDLAFWCDSIGWDWRRCINNSSKRWFGGVGGVEEIKVTRHARPSPLGTMSATIDLSGPLLP